MTSAKPSITDCPADTKMGSGAKPQLAAVSALTLFAVAALALIPQASAQTVEVVRSFNAGGSLQYPIGPITQGRNGTLYGTTQSMEYGSIFSLRLNGDVTATFAFDQADGEIPYTGITLGTDGNFYGTTELGGASNYGVLFQLAPDGAETVLHQFTGASDGSYPGGAPIEASDGNLYGTTGNGPDSSEGTVYKYEPKTGAFTTIYSGSAAYGALGPLLQASNGNLYGTASEAGASNCGAIFQVTVSGALVSESAFPCGSGGTGDPVSGLIQASNGEFYGVSKYGGNDLGTIFRMSADGVVTIAHSFAGTDGEYPYGGLAQATDGNLYGTATGGGKRGLGTIYRVTLDGGFTELYSFTSPTGESPAGTLLQDTSGLMYGTAYLDAQYGYGSVYSLNMGLGPFIAFVLPVGSEGQSAQILGQGFTGTSAVTFNGVPATSFKVASDTFLTAIVPSGASTGKVVVTTPGGALTSNVNFRITQ